MYDQTTISGFEKELNKHPAKRSEIGDQLFSTDIPEAVHQHVNA